MEPVGSAGVRLVRSYRADSTEVERVARSRSALACAGGLWSVTLNGRRLEVEPVFARHPESGVRGLQYMVPTRELDEGRRLLRITEVQAGDTTGARTPREYPICFWWGSER